MKPPIPIFYAEHPTISSRGLMSLFARSEEFQVQACVGSDERASQRMCLSIADQFKGGLFIMACDAKVLAEVASGASHTFALAVLRAWTGKVIVIPNMYEPEWNSRVTDVHIEQCEKYGYTVLTTLRQTDDVPPETLFKEIQALSWVQSHGWAKS